MVVVEMHGGGGVTESTDIEVDGKSELDWRDGC